MLMSTQKLLLRPGIALLPEDSKSRLDRFGVYVLGIYSNNPSVNKLISNTMLLESAVQVICHILSCRNNLVLIIEFSILYQVIIDIYKRLFNCINNSFYVGLIKDESN